MQQETAIGTFLDLLKQGKSVLHTAEGYSMFPTLRPGDRVLVIPVNETEVTVPGSIIVVLNGNTLIIHRLVDIRQDNLNIKFFITRGDSMSECDMPWQQNQLIGTAVSYIRNDRERVIGSRTPSKYEYKRNRILLWGWMKMKRFEGLLLRRLGDSEAKRVEEG